MGNQEFKPATRQGVKPLIGLIAESGCGKTYSALLLARGIAGPKGRIAMIDTESGRGSLYADVIPGGYDVLELAPPFKPQSYMDAITTAESNGFDVLVIDSFSHEWEGAGGVLDWASDNEEAGKKGQLVWKEPKMAHNRLVLRLLQTRLTVICCIRGKYKTRQVKDNGRTTVVKDDYLSPIQAEDFIFELTAHAHIFPNHSIYLSKCSHPALRECFPADNTTPLDIKHGEAIKQWSMRGSDSAPQKPKDERAELRRQIWDAAKDQPQIEGNPKHLEFFLAEEGKMQSGEELSKLSTDRLREIAEFVKTAFKREGALL